MARRRKRHDPIPDPQDRATCLTCACLIRIRRNGEDVLTPMHQPEPGPTEPDHARRAAGDTGDHDV